MNDIFTHSISENMLFESELRDVRGVCVWWSESNGEWYSNDEGWSWNECKPTQQQQRQHQQQQQ